MKDIQSPNLMSASSQLRNLLARSRALNPLDLETIIRLADLPGVRFAHLEPKGVVMNDVLTGVSGVIHVHNSISSVVIETLLGIKKTNLIITISRLGVGETQELEVSFITPNL